MAIYPVVLAGGNGTRLWPLSRTNHPKQFLDLLQQGETLLQSTLLRTQACTSMSPLIIANQEHRFLMRQQLLEAGVDCTVLLEPLAKNTAASILIACLQVTSEDPHATLLVLPSDHYLPDHAGFSELVQLANNTLSEEEIILLGIKPNMPATQYGYLKVGEGEGLAAVEAFVEKPNPEVAQSYLDSGEYLWNAGIVISKVQHLLGLFRSHQPALYRIVKQAFEEQERLYDDWVMGGAFSACESISFDYAILEQTQNIRALTFNGEWDDLGNWATLLKRKRMLGLSESSVSNQKAKLLLGVEGLIVIDDDDLLLVAHPDSLSDISSVTQKLIEIGRLDLLKRLEVSRPWGSFKVLSQGDNFLVKQLCVAPHSQISLQSHQHRSEHWVLVEGQGVVELNGEVVRLSQGQSISIGLNEHHRLSNDTEKTLKIIEVQTGVLLDESDIVRYEDKYDRHTLKK